MQARATPSKRKPLLPAPGWVVRRVNSITWELCMLGIFVFYVFTVFVALALDDRELVDALGNDSLHSALVRSLLWVDLVFMVFFFWEVGMQVWVKGLGYLRNKLNLLDFVVVIVSLVLTIISIAITSNDGNTVAFSGNEAVVLRFVKIVRLLRLALSMARLQQSRERHRRLKMVGLGAPVEKVFELIVEFRNRVDVEPEDKKSLMWAMDLIAKEELYKVTLGSPSKRMGLGNLSADVTDWLRSNLRVVGTANIKAATLSKDAPKKRTSKVHVAQPPAWLQRSLGEKAVTAALETVDSWAFDVFALSEASNRHPMVIGGVYLFERMGVLDKIGIPRDRLANFLLAVERGYCESNPFHNALHASDVMFTTHYYLQSSFLRDIAGPLDMFAAVLAASVHDYGHPGLSNPFLINTRAPEAILYNDNSVLEMFHISNAFRVMHTSAGCDICEFMSREQYRQFRETMIFMVLSTDLKHHFEHLGRLKTRVATDAYATVERKDVLLLLGLALHTADISNPTKSKQIMMTWTEKVMNEFWLQGDRERSLGIPISAFMDRKQPSVAQCQIGFINVLVKPLVVEWRKLLGDIVQPAIDCMEANLSMWQTEGSTPAAGWEVVHEPAPAPAANSTLSL